LKNQELVLITGGSGFIGRSLVAQISQDNDFKVFSVDLNHNNVNLIEGVHYIDCDLTDPSKVCNLPMVDYVFHLAAINGTERFYSEPWYVFYNSLMSTINVVNHFKSSKKIKRFVYTSSSEVYADHHTGERIQTKTDESVSVGFNDVLNPRWSYGGAKLAGEIGLNAASIQLGLPFTILRYHNVYGPNMGLNHVIPDFVARGNRGEYRLIGGDNVRSFIHIDDAVRASILAGFSKLSLGKIVHIGNESPISMINLARLIMEEYGWVGDLEIEKAPEGSTNFRCPDTTFLRNTLGFEGQYDLVTGIRNYIQFDGKG
jgi:nucleoside-diphosphate-sugar epimerase